MFAKDQVGPNLPCRDPHWTSEQSMEWLLLDDVSTLQRHEERVQVREESCKNANDADVPTKPEQESSSGFQV